MKEFIAIVGCIDISGYNDLKRFPYRIKYPNCKMFVCTMLISLMLILAIEQIQEGSFIIGGSLLVIEPILHFGSLFWFRKTYMK